MSWKLDGVDAGPSQLQQMREAMEIRKSIKPSNVGMRIFGGRMEYPYSDGGTAKTHHCVMSTALPFDAVRIVFSASNSVGVPITRAALCPLPTAADLNGSNLFWRQVTFNTASAGTIPSRSKNRRRTYLISDIIDISSVPRTDGGVYPLLAVRAFLGTPGTYTFLNNSSGSQDLRTWATHPSGRIHAMRLQDGDCVNFPLSFDSTENQRFSPIVGLIYYARGRVVNVAGFGDSITEGQGSYIGEGFGFPACLNLTEAAADGVAYEWSNLAWAGMTMYGNFSTGAIHDQVRDAATIKLPIDIAVMPCGSPNVSAGSPPTLTNDIVSAQQRQPFSKMLAACRDLGALPIAWSWLPTNPAVFDFGASDAVRVAYNAEVAAWISHVGSWVDAAAILSGTTDADGQVNMLAGSTTDGVHPNDAGNALLVPAFQAAISHIY